MLPDLNRDMESSEKRSTPRAGWTANSSPPIPTLPTPCHRLSREFTIPFRPDKRAIPPTCHRKVGECLHAASKAPRLTCSSVRRGPRGSVGIGTLEMAVIAPCRRGSRPSADGISPEGGTPHDARGWSKSLDSCSLGRVRRKRVQRSDGQSKGGKSFRAPLSVMPLQGTVPAFGPLSGRPLAQQGCSPSFGNASAPRNRHNGPSVVHTALCRILWSE